MERCGYSVQRIVSNIKTFSSCVIPLQWRHNDYDGVSNHQPNDCLPNRLFRRRSKKTSKRRVTGLCDGNSPVTDEFPAQMRKMFPFDDAIMHILKIRRYWVRLIFIIEIPILARGIFIFRYHTYGVKIDWIRCAWPFNHTLTHSWNQKISHSFYVFCQKMQMW